MSATNRGSVRNPRDFYPTPQWVVDALTHRATASIHCPKYVLVDGGAGDGRIASSVVQDMDPYLPTKIYLVDSDPSVVGLSSLPYRPTSVQADYLDWLPTLQPLADHLHLFVSNPPYRLAKEFLQATLHWIAENGVRACAVFLLRVNFLGSKKRAKFLNQNPPSRLTVITPRPSFTGDGTDMTEYAWFWWASNGVLDTTVRFDWTTEFVK